MTEREKGDVPDWAEQERARDLAWIQDNRHEFWPRAQQGYQEVGRGAVVADTTITVTHPGGIGHPLGYFDQQMIEQTGDEDTQRLVKEYEPREEFVATLLKTQERISSYRLRVAPRENLGSRVKQSQPEPPAEVRPEPPDLETLMQWEDEGFCQATDGCVVEPDGVCSHGKRSWLLELGLI